MNGSSASVVLHDDGNAFMCMGCYVIVYRTRDNPYPEMPHKKNCPVRIAELKEKMGYKKSSLKSQWA